MYQIMCDGYPLLDLREEELTVSSGKLQMKVNTAGSLQFVIYAQHPYYSMPKKLSSIITVVKDKRVIFKGRLVDDKQTFYNAKQMKCEGKLAFFNDSVFRPFEFKGSPEELFKKLIENHNAQVSPYQQFKIGRVTVTDPNDYIVRSSEYYLNTWEVMRTRLFDSSLGGFLNLRFEEDGDYIDYLADFEKESSQPIRFGENLLDFNRELSAEDTYTAMIPLGAEIEGKRVDITSVNNGLDYIVNVEKAREYGIIYAPADVSTWDDVTLPENLLKKAQQYLDHTGIKLKETMELSAVDLNLTDSEIESFNLCEYIPVVSEPHGINERYLLRELDIDLGNPQNTKITLGESRLTIVDYPALNDKKANDVSYRVKVIEGNYISASNAQQIIAEKTEDKVTEVMDGFISGSFVQGDNIELSVTEEKQLKISAVIPEGISPEVVEKSNNDEEYILTIKDTNGTFDTPNLKGINGEDGFTPKIIEDENNNSNTYKLNIVTKDGLIITPNLKGQDGKGSANSGTCMIGAEIRADGHLYILAENEEKAESWRINEKGHLVYKLGG